MNASRRNFLIVVLLLITVLSCTMLSSWFSSPKAYTNTLRTLDEQKQTVMSMNIAVTVTSTALSTLPNDMASPIADEIADLSLPLFIVLSILYLEKYFVRIHC